MEGTIAALRSSDFKELVRQRVERNGKYEH